METTICTTRTGLSGEVVAAIKRLAPRKLISHNVERQLAIRVCTGSDPLLDEGDLVIHKDTQEPEPDQLCEVVRVDRESGRVDLEDADGELLESVPFPADLIVFDLTTAPAQDAEEVAA